MMQFKLNKERIKKNVFWVCLIYFSFVAGLYFAQRGLMYFPNRDKPDIAQSGIEGMEELSVETEDGLTITGWYKAPSDDGKPVVIWFHGNAQHHAFRVAPALDWIKEGYGVLLAGYRGYAGNPGKPTEGGLYADARAYVKAVKDQSLDIVLYGESLGTGVAVETAVNDPDIRAIILEAPYTSTVDIAFTQYPIVPVGLLMKDRFENIDKIEQYDRPLLIVHGENDPLIPVKHGHKVFNAAGSDKKYIQTFPEAGHSNLHLIGATPVILEFLKIIN